jgi:hypothetical protein
VALLDIRFGQMFQGVVKIVRNWTKELAQESRTFCKRKKEMQILIMREIYFWTIVLKCFQNSEKLEKRSIKVGPRV